MSITKKVAVTKRNKYSKNVKIRNFLLVSIFFCDYKHSIASLSVDESWSTLNPILLINDNTATSCGGSLENNTNTPAPAIIPPKKQPAYSSPLCLYLWYVYKASNDTDKRLTIMPMPTIAPAGPAMNAMVANNRSEVM